MHLYTKERFCLLNPSILCLLNDFEGWQQEILDQKSMIPFVVLSSDVCLGTTVKRGVDLPTDHHLVVVWIHRQEAGKTWQTQTYCEVLS